MMNINFKNLKYPNLLGFFSILFLTLILYRQGILTEWVEILSRFGYLGAFLSGLFFVSTFTVVPATAILFLFAQKFNAVLLSLVAGFGGMAGDYLIFRFVKDELTDELRDIFKKVAGGSILKFHWIAHTFYFAWLSPVIGALIIASPLPDELGIGLLGIYQLDNETPRPKGRGFFNISSFACPALHLGVVPDMPTIHWLKPVVLVRYFGI